MAKPTLDYSYWDRAKRYRIKILEKMLDNNISFLRDLIYSTNSLNLNFEVLFTAYLRYERFLMFDEICKDIMIHPRQLRRNTAKLIKSLNIEKETLNKKST